MTRTQFLLWGPKGTLPGSRRKLGLEQWYSIWGRASFWSTAFKNDNTQARTDSHMHAHAELAGESSSIMWHDGFISWRRTGSGWLKVTIHLDLRQDQSSFLNQCPSLGAPASFILPNPAPRPPLCLSSLDPRSSQVTYWFWKAMDT